MFHSIKSAGFFSKDYRVLNSIFLERVFGFDSKAFKPTAPILLIFVYKHETKLIPKFEIPYNLHLQFTIYLTFYKYKQENSRNFKCTKNDILNNFFFRGNY